MRVSRAARRADRRRRASTIRIDGGIKLGGASHRLWGDYIEAGSWAVVAAVTGGEIEVSGARAEDIEVIAAVLDRLNLECALDGETLRVERSRPRIPSGAGPAGRRLTTGLWPGFPSDLVSLVTVLATQADGRTLVHDWLYELRLFALEQLSGMGAELFLCDPHRIIVTGPRRLTGRALDSRDLRSGMALIAAALAADGESRLLPLETVERGYGQLVERLVSLGARVNAKAETAPSHAAGPRCPTAATPSVPRLWLCARRRRGSQHHLTVPDARNSRPVSGRSADSR